MAFEVTYNCDICGTVGGAKPTQLEARKEAKEEGWTVLRIDNKARMACRRCRDEIGGDNKIRRVIRDNPLWSSK